MWNDPAVVRRVETQVAPEPCRLDEDLGAFVGEEVDVTRRVEVAGQREDHVGVDVVLRGSGGVVRRGLFTVDRAPRVQPPVLVQVPGPSPCGVEHVPSEPKQLACRDRVGVGEERDDVDLGVPEVVTVVAACGHAFGGDALLLGLDRGLRELEQVPSDRLLSGVVAVDLDVGRLPESFEHRGLLGAEHVDAGFRGAVQRARTAVDQLLAGHAGGRVVADVLGQA